MFLKYRKFIFLGLILIIALGLSILLVQQKQKSEHDDVHLHAGFVVFKDNKQVEFTDIKYMLVKPCNAEESEHEEDENDEQIEKAHLHDLIGDVVHVEKEEVEWKELFKNINYEIDYSSAQAYINDKKVDNFQNAVIQPYDSLVVLLGSTEYSQVSSKAATVEHIKKTEKRSENCNS